MNEHPYMDDSIFVRKLVSSFVSKDPRSKLDDNMGQRIDEIVFNYYLLEVISKVWMNTTRQIPLPMVWEDALRYPR